MNNWLTIFIAITKNKTKQKKRKERKSVTNISVTTIKENPISCQRLVCDDVIEACSQWRVLLQVSMFNGMNAV